MGQKVPNRLQNDTNENKTMEKFSLRVLGYLYAGLILPTWLAKWLMGFYGPYDEWSIGGIDVWAICAAHRELKLGMKSIIAWLDAIKNSISILLFKSKT